MSTFNPTFASWQTTSINGSTITDGNSATTSAINASGKTSTVVSVTIAYGGTANNGAIIRILQDCDGTNYEAATDIPWTMLMPHSTNTTYRRVFSFSAALVPNFKVNVYNGSGASVTATVNYRQSTTDQA